MALSGVLIWVIILVNLPRCLVPILIWAAVVVVCCCACCFLSGMTSQPAADEDGTEEKPEISEGGGEDVDAPVDKMVGQI